MNTVYVLELEKGKYYVGKTKDIQKRYSEHVSGYNSSAWTRRHKPIRIIEIFENAHCLDEDKITVEYMMKYGIDNVRGGPYVSTTLPCEMKDHITRRIRMASDACVYCGSHEHFCTKCPIAPDFSEKSSPISDSECKMCRSRTHFTEDCEFLPP